MRTRFVRAAVVLLLLFTAVFGSAVQASAALDDTYRFDELGFSVKIPKSFYVITVNAERNDAVFDEFGLDYDETMTAFKTADIYLRAYDSEKTYQISMTVTEDDNSKSVNNYSDLTAAERQAIVDSVLANESVSTAKEVKHNGNIFIDSQSQTASGEDTVYIDLCNTVINGMQIDLSLQKTGEKITPDEDKVLTNAASSLSFDKIRRNTGPVFEWWRLLLWIVILAGLSIAVTVIYKQYNAANKRKLEERRSRHKASTHDADSDAPAHAEDLQMTFEESLGYLDDEEFAARAVADEMAGYDINVRERDPAKGISFFEDEGSGIDDGTDYFDTYFREPTEKRTAFQRFFSAVRYYIGYVFKHIGYFFRNLFAKLFRKKKK